MAVIPPILPVVKSYISQVHTINTDESCTFAAFGLYFGKEISMYYTRGVKKPPKHNTWMIRSLTCPSTFEGGFFSYFCAVKKQVQNKNFPTKKLINITVRKLSILAFRIPIHFWIKIG